MTMLADDVGQSASDSWLKGKADPFPIMKKMTAIAQKTAERRLELAEEFPDLSRPSKEHEDTTKTSRGNGRSTGLFKPSALKLYERRDIPGLIKALGHAGSARRDIERANDSRHALALIGEPAMPLLLNEISEPACPPGQFIFPPKRCNLSRAAVEGIGEPAIPYLLEAVRKGDPRLAEGAGHCLKVIEKGGVAVMDTVTNPIAIDYPDDVKAAFEHKVGRPLGQERVVGPTHVEAAAVATVAVVQAHVAGSAASQAFIDGVLSGGK
jgi:hypothetical protein